MMTYKEFKNALTTELNTKLGTGGNADVRLFIFG